MRFFISVAAGLGLALALPNPVHAQSASPEAATTELSSYERLVSVMSPDAMHEATFAGTVAQLRSFYSGNPEFVLLEKQCAGLADAIFEKSRPEMRQYHWAEVDLIRALMLEIFSENLTPQQALEGAELYGTPLGQKVLLAGAEKQDLRNTMESAVRNEGGTVEREAFDRDHQKTTSAILQSLTQEEIQEFGHQMMQTQFFDAFQSVGPIILQRKFELINSDALDDYEKRMQDAMRVAMDTHLNDCG